MTSKNSASESQKDIKFTNCCHKTGKGNGNLDSGVMYELKVIGF